MGDDNTNQKKRKMKWITSYSNMTMVQAEKRLGFRIRSVKAISVDTMLTNTKYSFGREFPDAILKTKERVYDNIVEYLAIEGYPTEGDPDFKEANINHLVYATISPVLGNFIRMTGRKSIQLRSEKEIVSPDGETGGLEEFVMVDLVSVEDEKFVLIVEAKRSSLGLAMKQCLLAMKDMRAINGGVGEVYGFVTTGESWRMISYDGKFQMTNKMDVMFDTMDEDKDKWMKDHSILVDCMYAALSNRGIVEFFPGPLYTDNYREISLLEFNPNPLDDTEDTMGDDNTNQKKRKAKWTTSYSKMTIPEAEKRLGFWIDELRAVTVDTMLVNAKHSLKGTDAIKEKVYDRIVECLANEGYPTEASADFKEANVSDFVYAIIGPILFDFGQKTERKRLRLVREKEIISTDNETGGAEEFVVMDRISVGQERFVVVVMEAKRSSLGEAMKQCLLAMKDARDNNGGGEVYGFVTTGDTWRMLKYDGKFQMTEKMEVLFDTMDEAKERWMKDYSILVDCMYAALNNGGIVRNIPALDAGAQILAELRAIREDTRAIGRRLDRIESRFDSIEYNSIARHTNGHVNHSTTPLTPLRDSSNREVANFPADLAALVNMNAGELNQLLQAYGLPVVGNIGSRRSQLKKFIGVVMTWG